MIYVKKKLFNVPFTGRLALSRMQTAPGHVQHPNVVEALKSQSSECLKTHDQTQPPCRALKWQASISSCLDAGSAAKKHVQLLNALEVHQASARNCALVALAHV
jgi:hypothetical protein